MDPCPNCGYYPPELSPEIKAREAQVAAICLLILGAYLYYTIYGN